MRSRSGLAGVESVSNSDREGTGRGECSHHHGEHIVIDAFDSEEAKASTGSTPCWLVVVGAHVECPYEPALCPHSHGSASPPSAGMMGVAAADPSLAAAGVALAAPGGSSDA